MEQLEKYRNDFPMLNNKKMNGETLIYLDNSATTFKPKCVIDEVMNYYNNETTNIERGDYKLSVDVSLKYEEVRKTIAQYINANENEVIFTYGTTSSLNTIAFGLEDYLKKDDVILTTIEEHASDILPFFRLAKKVGAQIRYIPLDDKGRITVENFKKVMDEKVKLVTITYVSNVLGYINPIEEITKEAHKYNALVSVDGAQAVAHLKVDVKKLDVDFFSFSAHKMCGPSGIGALYGKKELLDKMDPTFYGGGANARFEKNGCIILRDTPVKFEAGTQPIEATLGFGKAAEYLSNIGLDKIHAREVELKNYLIEKMKKLDNVILYNQDTDTGIITFNMKGIFAQDVASYLSTKGIAVRSGQHCAKILPEYLETQGTVRCSLFFYNTFEECDKFVEALKTCTLDACVDIFF